MKFAVGYRLFPENEDSFTEIVRDYKEHIAELYFPWFDEPTCRASLSEQRGYVDWHVQDTLLRELKEIKRMGVKLDLLFNSNCYGGKAVSQFLEHRIYSIIEFLLETVGEVDIITTASPAIAYIVKKNFKDIETRASVNMRIGTVKGMEYLSDLFDSFHIQREFNRDLKRIRELKDWADKNEKKLILLINSGCLSYCSGQTFHDNMVAHEKEIDETVNIRNWTPYTCWRYLKGAKNWVSILQNTWIRPEDLDNYTELVDVVKIATRMHSLPRMVLRAYATRKHIGNLVDLCEPGFGPALAPYIIDNEKFPADWFKRTSNCDKNCHNCSYCKEVLKKTLTKIS